MTFCIKCMGFLYVAHALSACRVRNSCEHFLRYWNTTGDGMSADAARKCARYVRREHARRI